MCGVCGLMRQAHVSGTLAALSDAELSDSYASSTAAAAPAAARGVEDILVLSCRAAEQNLGGVTERVTERSLNTPEGVYRFIVCLLL